MDFLIQVTDRYWNLVVSSAADVYVSDNDPYNDSITPDGNIVFTGSTTVSRVFVSANATGWNVSATGQGTQPNSSNPSKNVPVIAQSADRIVLLLPGETRKQGKFNTEPKGKSGVPSEQVAGSTFAVMAYGADEYYNTDPTANFSIEVDMITDKYDINPSSLTLESGTTTFVFAPVVASSHTIKAQSSALPQATSVYYTPTEIPVWWNKPVKLHLLAEGQVLEPGKSPYDSNPATGGRENSPAVLTAGVTTQITVNLVDEFYNVVKGVTPFMAVSSNTPIVELQFPDDPNIQLRGFVPDPFLIALEDGTTTFSFMPVTRNPGGMSLRVVDNQAAGTSFSTDTVSGIVVNSTNAVALQLLVKDEIPDEGRRALRGLLWREQPIR